MATYDQLQAEPYWDREVVTPEMDWLGDELCRRTGRPRVAFGTKGDRYHLRGAHRSQEWIRRSAYCTNRTYTVQSGLTADQERHIAAADFTPGSAEDMIAQSKRILAAMKAGQLDEVREFYGNVDGDQVVDGWDNLRDRAASSDSSHLWHWHLTIDRRHCRNKQLMERILAIALDAPTGGVTQMFCKRGDSGQNVLAMQHLLIAAGQELSPDGQYGDKTTAAVKAVCGGDGTQYVGIHYSRLHVAVAKRYAGKDGAPGQPGPAGDFSVPQVLGEIGSALVNASQQQS